MISQADKQFLANGRSKTNTGSESEANGKGLVTSIESILWKAQQKQESRDPQQPAILSNKKMDITNHTKPSNLKATSTLADGSTGKNSETSR